MENRFNMEADTDDMAAPGKNIPSSSNLHFSQTMSNCEAQQVTLSRVNELMSTYLSCPRSKSKETSAFLDDLTHIMDAYNNHVKSPNSSASATDCGMVKKSPASCKRTRQNSDNDSVHQKVVRTWNYFKWNNRSRPVKINFKKLLQNRRRREEVTHLVHKVMSIHLISTKIFQYLSNKDLLNCSLVCKTWFNRARLILQQNRKCFALIDSSRNNNCRKLSTFISLLDRSQLIPFNGFSIDSVTCKCASSLFRKEEGQNEQNIVHWSQIHKMPIKYLKVINWQCRKNCQIFEVLQQIFASQITSQELLEISLFSIDGWTNIFAYLLGDNILTNLKCIFIPDKDRADTRALDPYIIDLIHASPKLQVLNVNKYGVPLSILPVLFETNKIHLLENLYFLTFIHSSEEEIDLAIKFSLEKPKLSKLSFALATMIGQPFDVHVVNRVMEMLIRLLNSSQESMKLLEMSHADLVRFLSDVSIGKDPPRLPLLKQLLVWGYNPRIRQFFHVGNQIFTPFPLSRINFSKQFPKLESVVVCRRWPWVNRPLLPNEESAVVALQDESFVANSVTRFKYELEDYDEDDDVDDDVDGETQESFFNFATLFPNVTELHIHNGRDYSEPQFWQQLWTSWPLLESLTLTSVHESFVARNLDTDFTGLSEQVCETMRRTKIYDVVADKVTSIRNLKRLKLLRIHIVHNSCALDDEMVVPKFITAVTGNCAFELMKPKLQIEISRAECKDEEEEDFTCQLALDDLKPFVKFVPPKTVTTEWDSDYFSDLYNIDWINDSI